MSASSGERGTGPGEERGEGRPVASGRGGVVEAGDCRLPATGSCPLQALEQRGKGPVSRLVSGAAHPLTGELVKPFCSFQNFSE